MRNSEKKYGFTKVDHLTFDVILPTLSPIAQLVLLRVYRQTVGWGKMFDKISLSQFRKCTGVKWNQTIRSAIQELAEAECEGKKLLVVVGESTEIPDYGLPYYMLEPDKEIALKKKERAQERTIIQEKRRKRKK